MIRINSKASRLTENGVALMMVLWVIVLLSIISLNFLRETGWNVAIARNFKEETISYYLAMSGYQEAMQYILSDKDPVVDLIDSEGNFWLDKDTEPITGKRVTPEGEIDIVIVDESARMNINYANQNQLGKLFTYIGVPQEDIAALSDSIMDWRDPDKEHHIQGAEDEYYESLEKPYKTKNGFFSVPGELALVKGIKPEYIGIGGEGRSLLPLITTFGRNTININTVSKDVMTMLGLNEIEVEAVLKQRNKESGGFRFIPHQFSSRGMNSTATQNFRIEITARVKDSKIATKIISVVNRRSAMDGYKLHTVYWRESVENIRG